MRIAERDVAYAVLKLPGGLDDGLRR